MSIDQIGGVNGHSASGASPRIPAWKRLGLKLKFAPETNDATEKPTNSPTPKDAPSRAQTSSKSLHSPPSRSEQPIAKKRRLDIPATVGLPKQTADRSPSVLKRQASTSKKSVKFTDDTKEEDGDTAVSITPSEADSIEAVDQSAAGLTTPPQKKAKKSKTAKVQAQSDKKIHSALQYLTEYHNSRESWKFNKNKETWILKHLFSVTDIPSSYDSALGAYLQGLRGDSARSRLAENARKEVTQAGESLAKTSTGGDQNMDDPAAREAYRRDAALRHKRNFEEYLDSLDSTEGETDTERKALLAKRKRGELVLGAVDADQSVPSSSTTGVSTTDDSVGSRKATPAKPAAVPEKSTSRKRKNRTAVIDISDTSSSGDSDSSDDDSDEEATTSTESSKSAKTNTEDSTSDSESSSDEDTSSSGDSSDEGTVTNGRSSSTVGKASSKSTGARSSRPISIRSTTSASTSNGADSETSSEGESSDSESESQSESDSD